MYQELKKILIFLVLGGVLADDLAYAPAQREVVNRQQDYGEEIKGKESDNLKLKISDGKEPKENVPIVLKDFEELLVLLERRFNQRDTAEKEIENKHPILSSATPDLPQCTEDIKTETGPIIENKHAFLPDDNESLEIDDLNVLENEKKADKDLTHTSENQFYKSHEERSNKPMTKSDKPHPKKDGSIELGVENIPIIQNEEEKEPNGDKLIKTQEYLDLKMDDAHHYNDGKISQLAIKDMTVIEKEKDLILTEETKLTNTHEKRSLPAKTLDEKLSDGIKHVTEHEHAQNRTQTIKEEKEEDPMDAAEDLSDENNDEVPNVEKPTSKKGKPNKKSKNKNSTATGTTTTIIETKGTTVPLKSKPTETSIISSTTTNPTLTPIFKQDNPKNIVQETSLTPKNIVKETTQTPKILAKETTKTLDMITLTKPNKVEDVTQVPPIEMKNQNSRNETIRNLKDVPNRFRQNTTDFALKFIPNLCVIILNFFICLKFI